MNNLQDQELINAGIDVIREKLGASESIPFSSIRLLAKKMIDHDKLGDQDWLSYEISNEEKAIRSRRGLAKSQGFAPFTNMGIKAFRKIQEDYAPWVLPVMAQKLKSVEDVYGDWSVQFADAMDALGQSACEASQDLFKFVTSSPAWEEARSVRDEFKKQNKPKKKKKNPSQDAPTHKKIVQNNPQPTTSPEGSPIPGKVEITLKIKEIPQAGTNQDKLRFFTVMQNDNCIHVTVKPKAFKKLTDAAEKFPEWIAAISGEAGKVSDNRIILEKPNIQVFERKPKEPKNQDKVQTS